jgi:hypothetical protein
MSENIGVLKYMDEDWYVLQGDDNYHPVIQSNKLWLKIFGKEGIKVSFEFKDCSDEYFLPINCASLIKVID